MSSSRSSGARSRRATKPRSALKKRMNLMTEPIPQRKNPFVGPRAIEFGELIHGRERETVELAYKLIPERVVLLYSPSGAGKTSLIQAALLEKLEAEGFQPIKKLLRINLDPPPWAQEIEGFNRYAYSTLTSLEEGRPEGERLTAETLAGLRLPDYLAKHAQTRTVLIFDQFEEILTLDPTGVQAKRAFFQQVGQALKDKTLWALFALREDHAAGLDPYRGEIPTRFRNTFRLDLLGKSAARQAIQRTARQEGVDFTDPAVDLLIDDLCLVRVQRADGHVDEQPGQYVEPMHLQVVCRRLWEKLEPGDMDITKAEVGAIGDVDQSLAEYFASEIQTISTTREVSERKIRAWFEHALISEGGIRKQVLMDVERSEGLENEAIRYLVDSHLVRREERRGAIWFELAHDRLVHPVQANNAAWYAAHLNLLQKQAALWNRQRRPASLLLAGTELKEAQRWAEAYPAEILDIERDFLEEASRRDEELRAQQEQEQRLAIAHELAGVERERAEALRQRNRVISAVGALAVIFALIAAYFGWQASLNATAAQTGQVTAEAASNLALQQKGIADAASTAAIEERNTANAASTQALEQKSTAEAAQGELQAALEAASTARADAETQREAAEIASLEADRQRLIALSRGLAAQANNYRNDPPPLMLLLSVEAFQTADTVEARSALLSALQRRLERTLVQAAAPVPVSPFNDPSALGFSPDGEVLAIGTHSGQILLWNTDAQTPAQPFGRHPAQVLSVAFSPDGEILASGDARFNLILWEASTGQQLATVQANDLVLSLAFSPDGNSLVSGGSGVNRRVFVWDVHDPQNPTLERMLNDPKDDVRMVAWSPDGTRIAAGGIGADRYLWVWDAATGRPLFQLPGHSGSIWSVAWAPDGSLLASGDDVGNIILWDAGRGEQIEQVIANETEVIGLAFSRDGNILFSANASGIISLWDAHSQALLFQSNTGQSIKAAFSPAVDQLALGSAADQVTLWDLTPQQPLREALYELDGEVLSLIFQDERTLFATSAGEDSTTLWAIREPGPEPELVLPGQAFSSAYSPAEDLLALGRGDGPIELIDRGTGETVSEVGFFEYPILSLAFRPDGALLAYGSSDSVVDLWDVPLGERVSPFSLLSQGEPASALGFSPDGEDLVVGYWGGSLVRWQYQEDSAQGSLPWEGQQTGIWSLAISPDGKTLVSGSPDQTIRVFDLETRQPIGGPLTGSTAAVTALAFHPGDGFLYAGEAGGGIARWDFDLTSWIRRACELAGRNFYEEEWDVFFPGERYRPTCPQWEGDIMAGG